MPSIAACSSGIGPTTSRRRLWSKAYLRMAGVAEACDALRRAQHGVHMPRARAGRCTGDMGEIWGGYAAGSGAERGLWAAGGGQRAAGGGLRAAGGGRGVLLGYPLLARVVEPPAVQRELVPAVHHAAQRPARPRDDHGALGERPHAQAHDGALAWLGLGLGLG